jgi:surface polysaccharide O-acyltransferase-like enzyme
MNRRYDLDWVRVCAFGLLVLYHVGMYYVTWDWHVKSPQAGPALEPLMLLTSPWRLSLLFLVSGAASAYILERRRERFLGERSWRLLVPLLFGMGVVVVPQAYYEVVEKLPGGYHDGYWAFYGRYLAADGNFCRDGDCLVLPTWNHLWFLAYLWVYTVLLWVGMRCLGPAAWDRLRERVVRALSGVGVLLWPVAFLAVARVALIGRFGSTHALVDDWYNHAQYLTVFVLGLTVARADAFWQTIVRQRWTALALAALSYAFLVWYFRGSAYGDSNPPPDFVRAIQRVVWAANQWSAIAAILGFAYRFRASNSRTLAYLVPAVLPVYILHQTVIVVLAHEFKPVALPPLAEGPLLVVLTIALCFGAYEVIRRVPALRPLFGLKREACSTRPARRRDIESPPGSVTPAAACTLPALGSNLISASAGSDDAGHRESECDRRGVESSAASC